MTNYIWRKVSLPIAKHLIPSWMTPNMVTLISFAIGIISVYFITLNLFSFAIFFLVISQILDVVDGDLAKLRKLNTKSGSIIDAFLDRIVDVTLVLGIVSLDPENLALLGIVIASGSVMISYVRWQAKAMGFDCNVGIASRDIRLLILMGGLFISIFFPFVLYYALILLATLISITVVQRVVYTISRIRES